MAAKPHIVVAGFGRFNRRGMKRPTLEKEITLEFGLADVGYMGDYSM